MSERGSSLLEVLAVGGITVLLGGQAIVLIGRVTAAGDAASEAARVAATSLARYATVDDTVALAQRIAPGADVEVVVEDEVVRVTVRLDVGLLGPVRGVGAIEVNGEAAAPISPHRSRP